MCVEPIISNGYPKPSGLINSGQLTKVICNSGYKIKGTADMHCFKGNFNNTPTCEGKIF